MAAQVAAGYIKDRQVVLHIPRWFWFLVFLANPQARTGLPTKIGVLLQRFKQSQTRRLSIASCLLPDPLALTFPLILVGQTCASWRNIHTRAVVSGAVPDVGGWWHAHAAEPGPWALCCSDAGESSCRAGCCCLQHQLWFALHRSKHHVTSMAQLRLVRTGKGFRQGKQGGCSSKLSQY